MASVSNVTVYRMNAGGMLITDADGTLSTVSIDRSRLPDEHRDAEDCTLALKQLKGYAPGICALIEVNVQGRSASASGEAVESDQLPNAGNQQPHVPKSCSESSTNNTSGDDLNNGQSMNKFLWSASATRLLITNRHGADSDFQRPRCKKTKIWKQIAKQMAVTGGYNVTGNECDDKWRSLVFTYKRNKDKKNTSGHESVSWEFFSAMDEVLGDKASVEPPSAQLVSSLPMPSSSDHACSSRASQSSDKSSEISTSVVASQCKSSSKKRLAHSEQYLLKMCEIQEKKLKMWEDMKSVEEKKIDAINKLAAAIAKIAEP